MELSWSFVLLLSSDLATVRQFLLKQTQLRCVMFEDLKDTEDTIDTLKVRIEMLQWNSNLACSFLKVSVNA